MKKGLSFLSSHMGIGITEDETNCREEITFAGSIATNNHIVLMRKRLDHGLILVAIDPVRLKIFKIKKKKKKT